MIPSPRRYLVWGLVLGVLLCLLAAGGLYLAGYHLQHGAKMAPSSATGPEAKGGAQVQLYRCPMHPEIVRKEPGKCPICGMDLVPVPSSGVPAAPVTKKEAKTQLYRCPMHPEIVQKGPGKCPICSMDLVPVPSTGAPGATAKKERKIKYWVAPMDPTYIRDQPGKSPMGMDLVPVYEDVAEAAATPGAIAVSPAAIQSMGVRTAKVEVRPLSRDTITVGKVTFNERKLAVVNTKVNGWVEKLYVNATGDPVRKGQALLSIYSPDLVSAQEEYLLALRSMQALGKSQIPEMAEGARRLLEASKRRLHYLDITAAQIETLKNSGQVKKRLLLVSPASGIVTKRMVTQGVYVQAGMPLLEVADLSTVWVDADIYQYELPWIKVGQPVEMTLEYLPGETFPGTIDYVYPYLKESTRTARVRLRFPNPRLKLKPEMFAQVKIKSPVSRQAVVVPTEAVLDSGLKQHVFVALGKGRFEPREVRLGVYGDGNQVREVLSGLKGGEEVVTSAQFLLDSESRFREAVAQMLQGAEKEPEKAPGAPKEQAPAGQAPPHKH